MTNHTADAMLAAEPGSDIADGNDRSPDRRVHHRGKRFSSLLSRLSCCSMKSLFMSNSVHFHANRVEDSVHVMITHDKEVCRRHGQPEKVYKPRTSMSEIVAAARRTEAARGASLSPITAQEEDGENEVDNLLVKINEAAVSNTDCVCGGNASQWQS